jgi:hypothetical protein
MDLTRIRGIILDLVKNYYLGQKKKDFIIRELQANLSINRKIKVFSKTNGKNLKKLRAIQQKITLMVHKFLALTK